MPQKSTLSRVILPEEIDTLEEGKILTLQLRVPCDCNLHCHYCYGSKSTGFKPISTEKLIEVLDEAKALGARTVSIVGEGEPLRYKRLFDIIDHAFNIGMPATLYSNCTMLTECWAHYLASKDVTVIGKMNSMSPTKQDFLAREVGAFRSMMQGLDWLKELGFNSAERPRLGLHTVILNENIDEIPEMWRMWRQEHIVPQVQVYVPPKQESQATWEHYSRFVPSAQRIRELFDTLAQIDREEFGYEWEPETAYPIAPTGCMNIRGSVGVTQEGRVQICAYLDHILAYVHDGLAKVLSCSPIKRIREQEFEGYPGKCYGCRALACNLAHDRYARDPVYDKFLEAGK